MNHLQILIVSAEDDAHIPFVSRHLPEKSFIVVDPGCFVRGKALTYQLVDEHVMLNYDGVSLDDIRSVWYRKPEVPKPEALPVAPGFRNYVSGALQYHFAWLLGQFPDAFWISEYYQLQKAANKMNQLALARKLGFNVPDTVLTADPAVAKKFLAKRAVSIVKPASRYGIPVHKDGMAQSTIFFATKLYRGQPVDLTNLELAPCFFQDAVDVAEDIRVNVVGDKVFAASITNPGLDAGLKTRDWRVGHSTGTILFAAHDLPRDTAERCVLLVKRLGLQFGALDIIVDTRGMYWFIECNPNGQWAFVEEETGQPIGKAIANLLVHHTARR